jgi:hypothetical protein
MRDTLEMAREAGMHQSEFGWTTGDDPQCLYPECVYTENLKRLVELVRADERDLSQKLFEAMAEKHKAGIRAERSANIACIGRIAAMTVDPIDRARLYEAMEAIRARGQE